MDEKNLKKMTNAKPKTSQGLVKPLNGFARPSMKVPHRDWAHVTQENLPFLSPLYEGNFPIKLQKDNQSLQCCQ